MSLLDLSTEILLEILVKLPDFNSLSSLLFAHPVFSQIFNEFPSTITTAITANIFRGGHQQLQCVSDLLHIFRDGVYTKPPSTAQKEPVRFGRNDIHLLLSIRLTLDFSLNNYTCITNQTRGAWSRFYTSGFRTWIEPTTLIDRTDILAMQLLERCFLRVYSTTMLIHHNTKNYHPRRIELQVQADKGKVLGDFFSMIPRSELRNTRCCLNLLMNAETTGFFKFMVKTSTLRAGVLHRSARAVLVWDYDFEEVRREGGSLGTP